MDIDYSLCFLTVLGLTELVFGMWTMTKEVSIKAPCQFELLIDSPFWFIIKGYVTFVLACMLYIYSLVPMENRWNVMFSTMIWVLIFGQFTWNIIGADVLWKCKDDGEHRYLYDVDRNALWIDILGGFLLLVFNIKLLFLIHQNKRRLSEYGNNYTLY